MSVAGVRLILFTLLAIFRLVGGSALFLGLFNLFNELSYGESFWLYSLLVLVHLGVDNLGVVAVVVVLLLLL